MAHVVPDPLSPLSIAVVKATPPALHEHGLGFTQRMYERLFADPAMKAMFEAAARSRGAAPTTSPGGSRPRSLPIPSMPTGPKLSLLPSRAWRPAMSRPV